MCDQVATEYGVEAMLQGSDVMVENLRLNAELLGIPQIGCEGNCFFQSVQCNVAVGELAKDFKDDKGNHRTISDVEVTNIAIDVGLKKDLGQFGGPHRDQFDADAAVSTVTPLSDLPDDYDKGSFFLCELGFHTYLEDFITVAFSGLRIHGGTPPTAPEHIDTLPEWAMRWVFINYPTRSFTDNHGTTALVALPNKTPFVVGPEMTSLM